VTVVREVIANVARLESVAGRVSPAEYDTVVVKG